MSRSSRIARLVALSLACWSIPALAIQPHTDAPPTGDGSIAPSESAPSITFRNRIRKQLASDCGSCAASGAVAGNTRYVISGELDADYRVVKQLVSTSDPKSSVLLRKASG